MSVTVIGGITVAFKGGDGQVIEKKSGLHYIGERHELNIPSELVYYSVFMSRR